MRWRASGIEGALTATAHRLTNRGLVVRKKDVSTADRLMRRHIQLFQLLGRQLTASVVGQLISRLLQAGLTPEVELSEAVEGVLDRQPAVGHINRQHLQGSEPDHILTSKEQRISDGVV